MSKSAQEAGLPRLVMGSLLSLCRRNLVVACEEYKQECERNRPDHWFLAGHFRRMVRSLTARRARSLLLWHGDADLLRESLEAVQQTAAVILGGITP
jgi:hypothetical protein